MPNDTTWSDLADLDDAAAQTAMGERFATLAQLPAEEMVAQMRPMLTAEYELDPPRLAKFTVCRLRALLAMPHDEAAAIYDGYNKVFETMPSDTAMRRATVVQNAARTMTPEEVSGLHALIPAFTSQIPVVQLTATPASSELAEPKKHPAWQFWKRAS